MPSVYSCHVLFNYVNFLISLLHLSSQVASPLSSCCFISLSTFYLSYQVASSLSSGCFISLIRLLHLSHRVASSLFSGCFTSLIGMLHLSYQVLSLLSGCFISLTGLLDLSYQVASPLLLGPSISFIIFLHLPYYAASCPLLYYFILLIKLLHLSYAHTGLSALISFSKASLYCVGPADLMLTCLRFFCHVRTTFEPESPVSLNETGRAFECWAGRLNAIQQTNVVHFKAFAGTRFQGPRNHKMKPVPRPSFRRAFPKIQT
jgi:hypothetical protein